MREIEGGTYLQCCNCGEIFRVKRKYKDEALYIKSLCSRCGNRKALNLGEDKSDIYLYYDVTKDDRYFNY